MIRNPGANIFSSPPTTSHALPASTARNYWSSGIIATLSASTGSAAATTGRTTKAHPTRSPRSPNTNLRMGSTGRSKRQRGATTSIAKNSCDDAGGGRGDGRGARRDLREGGGDEQQEAEAETRNRGERSRRRLAAFLEGGASAPLGVMDAVNRSTSPPRAVATAIGGGIRVVCGGSSGSVGGGGSVKQGPPSDNTRCVLVKSGEIIELMPTVANFVFLRRST